MEERFSLRDSELELPRVEGDERISASWIAARQRIDPSPRHEIARTFFKDALHRRLRLH